MARILVIFFMIFNLSFALDLEQAVKLALKNHPFLKQKFSELRSKRFDYFTTYGNFIPTLSFDYTYSKYRDTEPDYFSRNYSFSFYWTIYNSGQNILLNRIKEKLLKSSQNDYSETVLDIKFQIKKAYYTACANREILRFRKIQLKAAEKNFQMAEKKLKLGLVKRSDYLQAKVRLENVRYMLFQAENEYKKSIAHINSLIGFPLDTQTEIDTSILTQVEKEKIPDFRSIKKTAFHRPIFRQYTYDLEASKLRSIQSILSFTPSIYISYSINRDYSTIYGNSQNYNIFRIGLSWTIFEGLKRYYYYLSSKEDERFYRYRLKELKRQILLNLYSLYLDLKTSYKNLEVSKTLLKEAEHNYKQALGEYRVGKGDIISLVTAESSLANAHETYVQSLLNIALTKAILEREMGVEKLTEGEVK